MTILELQYHADAKKAILEIY